MFEYNIFSENSSEKFIETCEKISRNLVSAEKMKLLIDVDGSTIQKFLFKGKAIIVYDDYDVCAVFVKSEIPLDFLYTD